MIMNKPALVANASRSLHKIGLGLKKHSPEILAVVGVVGTVTSAVLACKATTKVSTILDKTKDDVDLIHACLEDEEVKCSGSYSVEDSKKDLTITYVQTGLQIAKLYAPSVILGVASIGCMLTSNNILRKRNIALAAAYTAVDKGFKEYRGRVVERFGKEVDRQLRYNIKAREIEETIIDEETGEEKTVKTIVETADFDENEFTYWFDERNVNWSKNKDFNYNFLRANQCWANDKLVSDGYLFLNDVLVQLGIDKCRAGNEVGWIYDPNNGAIDSYVDFGMHDMYNERKRAFVNGWERNILLEFNVDGYILDKAFKRKRK